MVTRPNTESQYINSIYKPRFINPSYSSSNKSTEYRVQVYASSRFLLYWRGGALSRFPDLLPSYVDTRCNYHFRPSGMLGTRMGLFRVLSRPVSCLLSRMYRNLPSGDLELWSRGLANSVARYPALYRASGDPAPTNRVGSRLLS